jgi:hypothetical protein
METCGSCRRHVHLAALVCPFCAIAISVLGCHRGSASADAGVVSTRADGGGVSTGAVYGGPPIPTGPAADVTLSSDATTSAADQRVVASLRFGFSSCASSALATDPTATGSAKIVISVDSKGDVTSTTSTNVSGLSTTDVSCMQNKSRIAYFEPGAPRTVTVAVTVELAKKE